MFWLFSACVPDLPPSEVVVGEQPWMVAGRTEAALEAALAAGGPRAGSAGRTRVATSVTCQPGPRGAGVLDVSVLASVTVSVPLWVDADDADPALYDRWTRFEDAVRAHEWGHADVAGDELADVDALLLEQPDCDAVFDAADAVFDALGAAQDAWDARHGAIRF